MILLNAHIDTETGDLDLIENNNNDNDYNDQYTFMKQCVFEGDFGTYSMFIGHPIIILPELNPNTPELITCYEYTSCSNPNSLQIFSKRNGVLILEFDPFTPYYTTHTFSPAIFDEMFESDESLK